MTEPEDKKYHREDADLLHYVNRLFGHHADENVLGEYLIYLNTEGDISDRTRKLYIKDLFGTYELNDQFIRSAEYTFFSFLDREGITSPPEIVRETVRSYVAWLYNHGIAGSSINRRISALRSFYKFLLVEGKLTASPIPIRTRNQRNSPRSSLSVKTDKRLPVFLTKEEMQKLLETPDLSKPEGQRDRTILELFYAAGLRVSELSGLNKSNLLLDSREIRVTGKGDKQRMVLIGIPALNALKEYLANSRPKLLDGKTSEALFVSRYGERLLDRRLQKLLKHYSAAIGLEKNVHPHVLRHTFATHMLDGGADLRVVQELLGHADLSSTQIYTHVTKQQARKVYLTAHPMAKEEDKNNEHSE
jgi:site-specific recombinase XerD